MILELVMITKNSGETIVPVLEAIEPFIDHWTILDTGSVDNTKEIIRKQLKNHPGKLYEEPFVDFSTSRNRVLELAGNKCKYTLMLDDSYAVVGGKILRNFLKNAKGESYNIKIVDNTIEYFSCRILRTDKKLRYRYRIHEVVDTEKTREILYDEIFIVDMVNPYMIARTKGRYERDIAWLLADHKDNPNDPRIVFYLAETYFRLFNKVNARKYYIMRINMGGNPAEMFLSYYNLGILYQRYFKRPWKKCEEMFLKAFKCYPCRSESLYEIAKHYYQVKDFEKASKSISLAVSLDFVEDNYPINYKIYREEIPYLFVEISIMLGEIEKAKETAKKIIKEQPESIQRFHNVVYALEHTTNPKLKPLKQPLLVIHSCHAIKKWSPKTASIKGSGSEIMAVNLAKEFYKIGYRVALFGGFDKSTQNGVEYFNVIEYNDFLKNNYVDVLVVSRDSDNLVYYDNIGKVFLWLHDILPIGRTFQTHKTKFKGILCLSNWHKKKFCEEFKFPEQMVYVTSNAIDIVRFNAKIEKVPYKFIYSSAPDRGLDNLLAMFPKIRTRYPTSELHIFGNENIMTPEMLNIIREHDYIILRGRVGQEEISKEYLSSDVWLYPTEFTETYCITALEAQISKVLCVCTKLASLAETVGNRGVLIEGKACEENFQNDMLNKLFFILDNSHIKEHLIQKAYDWAKKQTLANLAKSWHRGLFL